MDYNQDHQQYHRYVPSLGIDLRDMDKIKIWWIIIAWFISAPIGILMTVLKVIARRQITEAAQQLNGTAPRSASSTTYQEPARTTSSRIQARQQTEGTGPAVESKKGEATKVGGSTGATVALVCGILLLFAGITSISDPIGWLVSDGLQGYIISELFEDLTFVGVGGFLTFLGNFLKKRNRLCKSIQSIVGKKDYMYVKDIANALNKDEAETIRVLEHSLDKNYFGPEAYLDKGKGCLVVHGTAPESQQTREEKKAAAAAKKAVQQEESEYNAILRKLREINADIPGEEMTEKINRLEEVTEKIFKLAAQKPETLPKLSKFMSYYLPTSLKLLEQYAQFDKQGVEGTYISDSKRQIEDTMDTLVNGFEQQLDKLFANDALDVSSDIDVLKTMMAQDGLDSTASPFGM